PQRERGQQPAADPEADERPRRGAQRETNTPPRGATEPVAAGADDGDRDEDGGEDRDHQARGHDHQRRGLEQLRRRIEHGDRQEKNATAFTNPMISSRPVPWYAKRSPSNSLWLQR